MTKKRKQFRAILRKDLKLVFTWKTIILTIVVPFIMMFAIVGIPTLFVSGSNTVITVCNADEGDTVTHVNGSVYFINVGQNVLYNMQHYANQEDNIKIEVVSTRAKALNASNGIYFPKNFTTATFGGESVFEYHKTASDVSLQGYNFDIMLNLVQEVVFSTYLFFKNITEDNVPQVEPIQYTPPITEPSTIWSQETMKLAMPFAYALFILLSLIGNMGRTIGFSKEKEDGTFETMLSITKNRSNLVYSKLIVGMIASTLTILSYFAGSAIAGAISKAMLGQSADDYGATGFLSLPFKDLLSYKGVVLLIGLGLALILTMLALMTVDTLFTKTVAERIGVPIILMFGLLFMLPVMINPGQSNFILVINPYYWIYHISMSIADLSFTWVDGLYLVLFSILLVLMILAARKAIEREKVLFT
ncbi:MAG: ABC transporter permease [Candidatus Heimdallarchaeota archaeon]